MISSYPRGVSYLTPIINLLSIPRLLVTGSGRMDGQGYEVWPRAARRPYLLQLENCTDAEVTGITISNPAKVHLNIRFCERVWIHDFETRTPYNGGNTDSIHIVFSSDVLIEDCTLHGGDDNVSIVGSSSNILIQNVICTAGHGISIGSLGNYGALACVSNVTVRNVLMAGLQNGLRIKTYETGQGAVWNIRYDNITMVDVGRPIIIDQYYCEREPCDDGHSGIAVFNVSYSRIRGTTNGTAVGGIEFRCSNHAPCGQISLWDVHLRHSKSKVQLKPLYMHAYGSSRNVQPWSEESSGTWAKTSLSKAAAGRITGEFGKCGG
ncbi:unnamed protein product [Closterium sp. NIES-54]